MLALALKVLVPPGFMVAGQADGLPFPLVICTGQGTLTLDAARPAHDGPTTPGRPLVGGDVCAFAGHASGASEPSPAAWTPIELAAYPAPPDARAVADLAPGRGLAAPPLPARGPPAPLT